MILQPLKQILEEVASKEIKSKHKYGFSGSRMPYCPVREAITICLKSIDCLPNAKQAFTTKMKAEIGTFIHEKMQEQLATISGEVKLFGNWECNKCGEKFFLSEPVEHCGELCKYKEIEINDHITEFKGFVDALFLTNNGLILCDFKTKDHSAIGTIKAPQHKDRTQVLCYKRFLKEAPFNLDIIGQAIIYISRQDIGKFKVFEVENDELFDLEFDNTVKKRSEMKRSIEEGTIENLSGLCSYSGKDPWCPYNSICFGPHRDNVLRETWQKSKYGQDIQKNLLQD